MHVVIQHKVTDSKAFWDIVQSAPEPPAGMKAIGFYPSKDSTAAVCIYETDSLDGLRSYMDEGLKGVSQNTYFEINTEASLGLPS